MVFYFICLCDQLPEFYLRIVSQLDTTIFVSQDLALTRRVLDYLNAMERTKRILRSMAINLPAEYIAVGQVDKLFVLREQAEVPPQYAGYLLNIIYIEGLVNGESTVEFQQAYHNAYFSNTDLHEIRLELGGAII